MPPMVIITDAHERSWQDHMIAVPRIGESITIRDEKGNEVVGGTVHDVHWGLHTIGMVYPVVSVWLKDQ
jgi:hypothetical protein